METTRPRVRLRELTLFDRESTTMSEETEMISSDDSDTKELSSSKPKKSSGNGSGQEGSENFTPNSDVDQNEKIKVAIDAPDKSMIDLFLKRWLLTLDNR